MKKLNKFIYLFILLASFYSIQKVDAVYSDSQVGTYEAELAKFPTSYQTKIKELHSIYPNAIFVAQSEFLDWNKYKEVEVSWNDMLKAEMNISYDKKGNASPTSEIESYAKPDSYKSSICGEWNNKNKTSCDWYAASEEGITYYLNPYNFLDEKHVFMFQSQYYSNAETEEGVNNILSNGYKNKECPGSNGKTYAQVILEAAKENNISAYMLASRLRQENGKGTETLVTGRCLTEEENCIKYYNLYNIQASGSTTEEKISNGLKCASGTLTSAKNTKLCVDKVGGEEVPYDWTSPYLSILGGAKFIYKKYIGVNDTYNYKGQMTNYLQKWDPYGPNLAGHQYMQNIRAPYFEAESTYASNMEYIGKNFKYIFYIPIYQGAPNLTESVIDNTDTDKIVKSANYIVNGEYVSGFLIGTSQNDVINRIKNVDSNLDVTITKNSNNKSNNIATGDKIIIRKNNQTKSYIVVLYGDVNGDSQIKATDYMQIKNHIMGTSKLSGVNLSAADVNKDNNVKATDYMQIKNHIMGISSIKQ